MTVRIEKHSLEIEERLRKAEEQNQNEKRVEHKEKRESGGEISMNYGAEPADQVVRYSLEGMEYSLKITGNVAKHVAIFIGTALKDQKKTRGKTRLTRMLKEQRPMKFFYRSG